MDIELGQNYKHALTQLNARVPFEEAVALARQQVSSPGLGNDALREAWTKYLE